MSVCINAVDLISGPVVGASLDGSAVMTNAFVADGLDTAGVIVLIALCELQDAERSIIDEMRNRDASFIFPIPLFSPFLKMIRCLWDSCIRRPGCVSGDNR